MSAKKNGGEKFLLPHEWKLIRHIRLILANRIPKKSLIIIELSEGKDIDVSYTVPSKRIVEDDITVS